SMARCKSGMLPLVDMPIPIAIILVLYTPWPGLLMGNASPPQARIRIVPCKSGMLPLVDTSIPIAAILLVYLPWPGLLMGNASPRGEAMARRRCGAQDHSSFV